MVTTSQIKILPDVILKKNIWEDIKTETICVCKTTTMYNDINNLILEGIWRDHVNIHDIKENARLVERV